MPNSDIAHLQAKLVEVAVKGTPLAGINRDLSFPDLQAVRQSPVKYVSSKHLAMPHALGDHIEVFEEKQVREKASTLGPFAYLRFQEPMEQGGQITLSLQLMTGFDDVEPLALGAIVATFEKRGEDWIATEPTHVLAY
jgi:hypothetical protein